MLFSEQIFQAIQRYLTENGWTFDADQIHGTVSVEAELQSRMDSAMVVYQAGEDGFLCYTALPVNAEPAVRAQVGEYLHRANYGLPNGNFEFDYDDGSIHYKTSFDCPDGAPTQKQLEDSLAIGLTVIDRYGDGLLDVMGEGRTLASRLIEEIDGAVV